MSTVATWFTLGTVGMLLGAVALWVAHRRTETTDRTRFAILVAVPLIALVAYALMALGFGAVRGVRGNVVYLPRYVDWLLTTPLHVTFIGLLAGVDRRDLGIAAGLQAATILLGLVAALVASPLSWLLYLAGSAAFAGVIYYAFGPFAAAAAAQPAGVDDLFRKLRAFVIVLWLIYPVIWVVAPAGLGVMDVETTALVVSYIDVVAKVGFGLIALNGQYVFVETAAGSPEAGEAATAD